MQFRDNSKKVKYCDCLFLIRCNFVTVQKDNNDSLLSLTCYDSKLRNQQHNWKSTTLANSSKYNAYAWTLLTIFGNASDWSKNGKIKKRRTPKTTKQLNILEFDKQIFHSAYCFRVSVDRPKNRKVEQSKNQQNNE